MILESAHSKDYLAASEVVDADHPAVRGQAESLVANVTGDIDRARRLFEWVRDEISHTHDAGRSVVTCSASEVLEQGTGICFAKSHLLAALCRAVGIPTGFCYQTLRDDDTPSGYVLHGFNALVVGAGEGGAERWVRVDARGNKSSIDAQFSLDEERLAFPVDEALGETTHPKVWVEPAPIVVATLRSHDRLDKLWANLPVTPE